MATSMTEREILRSVYNTSLNSLQINFLGESIPQFATVELTESGDVIDAVANKKIRVIAMFGSINAVGPDGTIKFQSGGATDLTGAMLLLSGQFFHLDFNPRGWFETVAGEKLNMVISNMDAFSGTIIYIEADPI